jgi:hypothetical protein
MLVPTMETAAIFGGATVDNPAICAVVNAVHAVVVSAVTRPLASVLITGIISPDPIAVCAVVIAAKVGPG